MKDLNDSQIRHLQDCAGQAGDALQVYICRVALGESFDLATLNDESCLDRAEALRVEALSTEDARAECARVFVND